MFRETLELAGEAGVPFCGVLCGRATWKGGIEVFATQGPDALEVWLQEQGVANIQSLNQTVRQTAQAWYTMYGGQDNIEIAG